MLKESQFRFQQEIFAHTGWSEKIVHMSVGRTYFSRVAHEVVILVTRRTIRHRKPRIFAVGLRKNSTIFGRGHNGANEPCPSLKGFSRSEKSPGAALTSSSPGSKAASLYHYFRSLLHQLRKILRVNDRSKSPKRKLVKNDNAFPRVPIKFKLIGYRIFQVADMKQQRWTYILNIYFYFIINDYDIQIFLKSSCSSVLIFKFDE